MAIAWKIGKQMFNGQHFFVLVRHGCKSNNSYQTLFFPSKTHVTMDHMQSLNRISLTNDRVLSVGFQSLLCDRLAVWGNRMVFVKLCAVSYGRKHVNRGHCD